MRVYIWLRSPKGIAYAIPHLFQNENPHVHILYSANEFGGSKSIRISKNQLESLKLKVNSLEQELFEAQYKNPQKELSRFDL